jgi:hypothetical protein
MSFSREIPMHLRFFVASSAAAAALAFGPNSLAHKAHEHGAAKLDVAVAGTAVTVTLDTPLDSIVGFERAPRNDAERARVAKAEAALRDAAKLFAFDAAAGCTAGKVELKAPVLGWGGAPPAKDTGHADLEASFEFACQDATKLRALEHRLFAAFASLKRIDVQVAGPRGQVQAVLRPGATRVNLVR